MKLSVGWLFDTLSRAPWRRRLVLTVVVTLVLVRLWLVAGQTITAYGSAAHDDAHFLLLATRLVSGKWLGPYSHMTLIKGPFYSMWIATAFALGIPLLFAEHLLYVASCGVFVRALAPVLRSATVRLTLFAVLLFNPVSFADGVMSRVLREAIYGSLSLLVLGAALGLALRQDRPFRSVLPWALGLGTSLAAFFLCREERIWLLPSLLVVLAGAMVHRPSSWRVPVRLAGIALAVFVILVGAVMVKNRIQYGVYVITEYTEGPFMTAYGAVTRVRHAVDRPYVPLPTETRQRIYRVSPRFAELAPYLEGEGRGWSVFGCAVQGICDETAGGWMMWALRDAAAAAKHYTTGSESARYWAEVAIEVNRACDDGRLKCESRGIALLPPLRRMDINAFGDSITRASLLVAEFQGITFHSSPSEGPVEQLDKFFDITRTRLAPDPQGIVRKLWHQDGLTVRKETLLQWNLAGYHAVTPLLACMAVVAFSIAVVIAIFRRNADWPLLAASAVLVGTVSRIAIIALVDATSFRCVLIAYLIPAYALLLGFVVLAFHAALITIRKARASRSNAPATTLGLASAPPRGG